MPEKGSKITSRSSYWILLTISSIVVISASAYFLNLSAERAVIVLVTVMLGIAFAFYLRVRPSIAVNRVLFIFIGSTVLGGIMWAMIMLLSNATGFRWVVADLIGDSFFALFTLIICWILGGFIGDLIGKSRNYMFPQLNI